MHSTKASCRTTIDLVINERLGRIQNKTLPKNLEFMVGEPMTVEAPGRMEVVTGDMDYIVGYSGRDSFIGSLIVVQAKHPYMYSVGGGLAECTAYLGMPYPCRTVNL